jgi:polyribonucleotide nucleotidyltransferase
MNKQTKKKIETELHNSVAEILKRLHPAAATAVAKHLKQSAKKIAKKFLKAIRTAAKAKPVKKKITKAKQRVTKRKPVMGKK